MEGSVTKGKAWIEDAVRLIARGLHVPVRFEWGDNKYAKYRATAVNNLNYVILVRGDTGKRPVSPSFSRMDL